ncbi:MAG: isoprenyl transferase [Lentisphaeria bacterium]|nr:isoprenyl transferase [Lentisphaeria bacterium]
MSAENLRIPRHVAIIMDGNGRWARERGLPRSEGHRAGAESVRRVVEACNEFGVHYLTLYAFSTENWQRPKSEVQTLMRLLRQFLEDRSSDLQRHCIRLDVIGEMNRLPAAVQRRLRKVMDETSANTNGVLTLALSYGSRAELVRAARALAAKVSAGDLKVGDIDERRFAAELYTAGLPDPDLVIRTAGEQRLSNFLLWQASYAEFWVTSACWPDFGREHFLDALRDFSRRQRRFGGVADA